MKEPLPNEPNKIITATNRPVVILLIQKLSEFNSLILGKYSSIISFPITINRVVNPNIKISSKKGTPKSKIILFMPVKTSST